MEPPAEGAPPPRELAIMIDGYAAVRLWLDSTPHGRRLRVEDLESGAETTLTPLELASFTFAAGPEKQQSPVGDSYDPCAARTATGN
jgi:hypothetical protein